MVGEQDSRSDGSSPQLEIDQVDLRQLARDIADQFRAIIRRVACEIDWPKIFDTLAGVTQVFEGWFTVEHAFAAVELVPSQHMDRELIERVVVAHKDGDTRDDICAMVLSFYDEDGARRIEEIVERLEFSPYFIGRQEVLREVLIAHRVGLDSIATYPLVAMIEGILMASLLPYVRNPKKDLNHNKLVGYILEMPVAAALDVGFESVASMIAFMEGSLYHSSYWWDDEDIRSNHIDLNRHRLLHGMATRGTRIHTLRCFLMLDLIADLLPGMCAELADAMGESNSV